MEVSIKPLLTAEKNRRAANNKERGKNGRLREIKGFYIQSIRIREDGGFEGL